MSVFTFHRKSCLLSFLLVLSRIAIADTINLAPIGLILYAMGISFAVEQIMDSSRVYDEDVRRLQEAQEEFQRAYEEAMIEFHVLRGKRNVDIVPITESGKTVWYAV